jgi:hypothetical protein
MEDSVDPDNMTYEVHTINVLFPVYSYCSIKSHVLLPADYDQLFLKGLLHSIC